MPNNLKDKINVIESSEKEVAVFQSKINKLQELVEKQKKVMQSQETIIEEQKSKIAKMYDVPEDLLELKELIGTQRAIINEKDKELEHFKGEAIAFSKELEQMKKHNDPIQKRLDQTYETIGNIKAELAEKKSELLLKEELIKNLQNKVVEIQAFADKLQDEQLKLLSDMDQKCKNEIENLRQEHIEEKKDLTSKIAELDAFLLDSKLLSTEASFEAKDFKSRFEEIRNKQENLINKLESTMEEKRIAEENQKQLQDKFKDLTKFKENNIKKITYYNKLTELMEHEAQFKAFLILEKVKTMSLDDLKSALGAPIILVKKLVQNLEKVGLIEIEESGKLNLIDVEER
jgi:chromosome segregation ATPase